MLCLDVSYISSKCLILLQPVGLPMWKSRPSSSSLIMVVRHGGSQMHSVEAVQRSRSPYSASKFACQKQWLPTCQLFNSLQWVHSCDVDSIWLSKICNFRTFAGEGNLFDPWRGEGSGGFFLHLCSSEVRSDGGDPSDPFVQVGVEEKWNKLRPWNFDGVFLWYIFFMIHVNVILVFVSVPDMSILYV